MMHLTLSKVVDCGYALGILRCKLEAGKHYHSHPFTSIYIHLYKGILLGCGFLAMEIFAPFALGPCMGATESDGCGQEWSRYKVIKYRSNHGAKRI